MRMGSEIEVVGLHIVQDSDAGLRSREIKKKWVKKINFVLGAFKIGPPLHYFAKV